MYTASLIHLLGRKNIISIVLIPNYGKLQTGEYNVQGIRVIQYSEPSIIDRELIMGKRIPAGLSAFKAVLLTEKPDIIQFHIIGMSNGITKHHLFAAKQMGFKVVMTFHLAGYSCKTGNLMYKDEVRCDGFIDIKKCTWCNYTVRNISAVKKNLLYPAAMLGYKLNKDTSGWTSQLGTALGFPFIIQQLKDDLLQLAANCDKMVVLTKWYRNVLLKNGIAADKLQLITQGLPWQQPDNTVTINRTGRSIKLVFIGRIIYSKGLHLLISALKKFPEERVSLDIYGQVNENAYAQECIAEAADCDNIIWKGMLLPNEVVSVFRNYDLLCVPSIICEMSPLVIQEAFAAGIPVLASDVYGNAEQVNHGINGWLFKFKDNDDLQVKLELLIANPDKITVAKRNIPGVKKFSEVADEYEQLYKSLKLQ